MLKLAIQDLFRRLGPLCGAMCQHQAVALIRFRLGPEGAPTWSSSFWRLPGGMGKGMGK